MYVVYYNEHCYHHYYNVTYHTHTHTHTGTKVRLPLPEDLVTKNKKKKASKRSDQDNRTNDVMFTHSLLKKRAVVVHRALDNEAPNQIAKKFNVDVQTLIDANSKRFKGFRANSKLIENTEVIIPSKESNNCVSSSKPSHPQYFKTSVARKTASSGSLMSSDSILDPLSSAKYLKSISSSGDRWSRSKLMKMAESLERVLLSNAAKSKRGGRKRKKKSSSTAKKSFGNMDDAPQTVDGVPIVLGSKVLVKSARLDALQEANVVQIEKSVLAVKVRYDEWDSAEFDEYHPLYCISLQSTNQVLRSIPAVGTDIYVRPTTSTTSVVHAYTASVKSTFQGTLILVKIVDNLSPDWTNLWVPLSSLWSSPA